VQGHIAYKSNETPLVMRLFDLCADEYAPCTEIPHAAHIHKTQTKAVFFAPSDVLTSAADLKSSTT
jgi:hypothetical protein